MPAYQYKAVNAKNEILEGELEAASDGAVRERLHEMGYFPISVDMREEGVGGGFLGGLLGSQRVSQDDLVIFTSQLSTLLRAGLPLDRALELSIGLAQNERFAILLQNIRKDVRGGASLFDAMSAREGVFSRFYLNMIRAGEAGGALDMVLQRLSDFMERSKELKETVKSALIYPTILVLVAVVSVVVLLIFVVPQFTQMFEESGRALPVPTQIVVNVGTFFQSYWWALLLSVLAMSTVILRQRADPESRYFWDGRLLKLPLVGDLIAKMEVARFSRTLGTLLDNGVSLLIALNIVKETLGNTFMAERLDDVSAQLREGKGIGQPLLEAGIFPKLAVHMVMVGEETGRLGEMLIQVADVFEREVRTAVKRLLGLLEPVMILGLGLLIGGIIMSILIAILDVNELTH